LTTATIDICRSKQIQ